MGAKLSDRLQAVGGLCNQFHVGVIGQQPHDSLPKNRVVVDGQDPDPMVNVIHDWLRHSQEKRCRREFGDFVYALAAGMLSSISVPASSWLQTSKPPPTSLARSRMPRKPQCPTA